MTRISKPITQEELERDADTQQHERRQKLFDALATVVKMAIYIIPSALGFFYIAILGHKIYIGDWNGLEIDIRSMLIPVAAYFVGIMSKSGILPK